MSDLQQSIRVAKILKFYRVIAKLTEMGWAEELSYMASEERHPLFKVKQMKQIRALTERGTRSILQGHHVNILRNLVCASLAWYEGRRNCFHGEEESNATRCPSI